MKLTLTRRTPPVPGMNYNIFPWYRAGWGRYTQADPLRFFGSTNLFEYSGNNPITFDDPYGLMSSAKKEAALSLGALWFYYQKMRDVNFIGADKYYHCIAHCTATKVGPVGSLISGLVSNGREWVDFPHNLLKDPPGPDGPMDVFDSWEDCSLDINANEVGRNTPPNKTCEEGCQQFRPPGFPY